MSNFYPWIYVNQENDIWKFSLANRELCCQITYGDESGTKEGVIDKRVICFAVCIETDGKIHIVYSNENGQIKYCTLKENKWYGRTLYLMDSSSFRICNIKIDIIGDEMHIFYLMIEEDGRNNAVLVHSIWNGRETRSIRLSDLVLIPEVQENYMIHIDKDKNIHLLFLTGEGAEASVNYCCYKNHGWTRMKRLYGVRGQEIAFEMHNDQKYIHILNKHREGGSYYLDHVRFGRGGDIQKFRVYESRKELTEPLIFRTNERLFTCWLEENKIYYSLFDGIHWGGTGCFSPKNIHKLQRYHFFIACDNETMLREKEVYGTGDQELDLFFPSEIVSDKKIRENQPKGADQARRSDQPAATGQNPKAQSLKLQLYREKSENNRLKTTIASLSAQLQKKQSMLDAYKSKFEKLLEQKKNTDENCDMFIEMQQNLQSRLESLTQKLKEEEEGRAILENRLRSSEAERQALKREIDVLTEEKDRLLKELEGQNNKTFMERLLKM